MRPLLRKSSAAKVVALSVQTAPPASMPLVVCWCRVVLLSACSLAAAVCSRALISIFYMLPVVRIESYNKSTSTKHSRHH